MDCKYPSCNECEYADCVMENKDIAAMLKRRRWAVNPALYRQKQQDYRARVKANLPHCDECENCILVEKEKHDGYKRLCIDKMRLIEQKVPNCPQWCRKRRDKGNENAIRQKENRYLFGKKENERYRTCKSLWCEPGEDECHSQPKRSDTGCGRENCRGFGGLT